MKENYEELKIEVIHFDNEDVITTSDTGGSHIITESTIEFPFIPVN